MGWSRGNLLGFLLAVWTFLFLGRKMVGLRPKIAVGGLVLLLMPILALGAYELTPREIVDSRVVRSQTVYSRLGAWQRMLEEGLESPIFGIGLNNLRNALAEDRINVEGVYSEDNPHNSLLSIFAEMGLVGLSVYLLILMSLTRIGTGLYRGGSSSRERWRGIAVISILVGYWIPAFFVNAIYIPAVCHLYVYVYFGAIAGLHGKRRFLSPMSSSTANNRWIRANAPVVGASQS
jgi:O-antigen ligase